MRNRPTTRTVLGCERLEGRETPSAAGLHSVSHPAEYHPDARVAADLRAAGGTTGIVAATAATGIAGASLPTSTVKATATTLAVSPNPTVGAPVTLTATVTAAGGTPNGMVTFKDGATVLGTSTLTAGRATFATTALAAGGHHLTAVYNGTAGFRTSTSAARAVTVAPDARGTSTALAMPSNPVAGRGVTLTATVTAAGATPGGTVTFRTGSTVLGTAPLSGGRATFTTYTLTAGAHQLTAAYGGASGFAGSTSALDGIFTERDLLTVAPDARGTSTALAVSAAPTAGRPVTLTATVTATGATPGGTVTFRNGTTVLGTAPVSGGRAALTTSALAAGSHRLTATYGGAVGFHGSTSATATVTVAAAPRTATQTTVATSASATTAGQSVALTATVRPAAGGGTPAGTVTFKNGTATLGTVALSGGRATFTTAGLAAGSHRLTAVYNGAGTFAGSTSAAATVSVAAPATRVNTTTALAVSTGAAFYGQPVTATATVRPAAGGTTPTGTVTFRSGSVILGTVAVTNGSAALTLSALRAANHSLTATYNGDGRANASTSAARAVTVNRARTVVDFELPALTSRAGSTLTLRAKVTALGSSAVPAGEVVFKADALVLGTVALDRTGTATLTVTNRLAVGQHWIVAGYFGSDNFAPDGAGDILTVTR
jgi:hypothetical protein